MDSFHAAAPSLPAVKPASPISRGEWIILIVSVAAFATNLARQYFAHWNPRTLFASGGLQSQLFGLDYAALHWFEAPLLVVGLLWLAVSARRSRVSRFLLAWWIIYPLPASLDTTAARKRSGALGALPLVSLTSAIGVERAWFWLRHNARRRAALALAFGALGTATLARYSLIYFHDYPAQSAAGFQAELPAAFSWLAENGGAYDAAIVAYPRNQPYAYYVYFTPYDPHRVATAPVDRRPGIQGFDDVYRFDRAFFVPSGEAMTEAELRRVLAAFPAGSRIYVIARPGQVGFIRARVVLSDPSGATRVAVHEWIVPVATR